MNEMTLLRRKSVNGAGFRSRFPWLGSRYAKRLCGSAVRMILAKRDGGSRRQPIDREFQLGRPFGAQTIRRHQDSAGAILEWWAILSSPAWKEHLYLDIREGLAVKTLRWSRCPTAEPSGRRLSAGPVIRVAVNRGSRLQAGSPVVDPWREGRRIATATRVVQLPVSLHFCVPGIPVDAAGTVAPGLKHAEPVELAHPEGRIAANQRGAVVGAGFAVRYPIPQHHAEDPRHLLRGRDDGALAFRPHRDLAVEAFPLILQCVADNRRRSSRAARAPHPTGP